MTLRNPSESEVRHKTLIQPIVSTQSRSVARRGGNTGGGPIKDTTPACLAGNLGSNPSPWARLKCSMRSAQPMTAKTVSLKTAETSTRLSGRSSDVCRCGRARPPGSTPGHVFPSTLEGGLADACRQRLRTPLVSAPSRTQDSRRSRDRRGLQVKSRLKCIADPGGRPTLRPLGILNTEVHQCSFCPGRKTNRS